MILHISDRHVTTSLVNHDVTEFHYPYKDNPEDYHWWYYYPPLDKWYSLGETPATYAADVSLIAIEYLWGRRLEELR